MIFRTDPLAIKKELLEKVHEIKGFENFELQAHHEEFLDLFSGYMALVELSRKQSYLDLNPETATGSALERFATLSGTPARAEGETDEDFRPRILTSFAALSSRRTSSFYKGLVMNFKNSYYKKAPSDCYAVNALEDQYYKENLLKDGKSFIEKEHIGKVHLYVPYPIFTVDLQEDRNYRGIYWKDNRVVLPEAINYKSFFDDEYNLFREELEDFLNLSKNRPFGYEARVFKPKLKAPPTQIRLLALFRTEEKRTQIKKRVNRICMNFFEGLSKRFVGKFTTSEVDNLIRKLDDVYDIEFDNFKDTYHIKFEDWETMDTGYYLKPDPKKKNEYILKLSWVCETENAD